MKSRFHRQVSSESLFNHFECVSGSTNVGTPGARCEVIAHRSTNVGAPGATSEVFAQTSQACTASDERLYHSAPL